MLIEFSNSINHFYHLLKLLLHLIKLAFLFELDRSFSSSVNQKFIGQLHKLINLIKFLQMLYSF